MFRHYHYDERNKLLVLEHVGRYVGAEFQTALPELFEKVEGEVKYIFADMSKVTSATIADTDVALLDLTQRKVIALGIDLNDIHLRFIIPQDGPKNLIKRYELLRDKTSFKVFGRSVSWERAVAEMHLKHLLSYPFDD